MATVLERRVDEGWSGDDRPRPVGPADAGARGPVPSRRGAIAVIAGFGVLLAAFALHLAAYGAWVVDDAGISMAYALNLAHGHGLVAQPGASPVEAFSDPLWVLLLAGFARVGILGRTYLFGVAGYVAVVKGLALAFHGVVLACTGVAIRRILTVVRGRPPALGVFLAVWGATGLLLAANPSYVVWMGSGLENALFAAEVAAMAAVATVALPVPDRRSLLGLGALAGAAALTRPDGIVYAGIVVVVALLADVPGIRRRAALAGWGLLAFAAVFGTYLAFRRAYFGAWIPNTAVAKAQQLPSIAELARLDTVVRAWGWPLVAVAAVGGAVACVRMVRCRNRDGLRVVTAGVALIGAGLAAFVVLPVDWMAELRFLTPVWPLLSAAAALGVAQLADLAESRSVRVAIAVTLALFAGLVIPGWRERTQGFRASPTLPLCTVATRYGLHFDRLARVLEREPAATSVLLPDIGGVLLATDLRVVDLAGLADPTIARFVRDQASADLARYVLDDVRPTLVDIHGDWVARSGLLRNPRFRADYVAVLGGEDWVRRDAVAATADPAATLARLRAAGAAVELPPATAACAGALFG